MEKPMIRPLSEMIAELDEEARRTEAWRKAQGIPKSTYQMSQAFSWVVAVIDGGG